MTTENKIRRHGYHLMSLASVGATGVLFFGLFVSAVPWLAAWHPEWTIWKRTNPEEWSRIVAMGVDGLALLSASSIVWMVGQLVPLLALRRLGKRLYQEEALTRPVADAFRWLAHSLPINAVLRGLSCLADEAIARSGGFSEYKFEFDLSGSYIFLIACLCLYSVAHLMRLATEAADDARSIV